MRVLVSKGFMAKDPIQRENYYRIQNHWNDTLKKWARRITFYLTILLRFTFRCRKWSELMAMHLSQDDRVRLGFSIEDEEALQYLNQCIRFLLFSMEDISASTQNPWLLILK